jgi:preprotein translocase subunit SecG
MQLFVTILHVMLSFTLIGIILLQPGKDGASVLGGGGGGNQMYGPRGQSNLLGRATTLVAGLFMVTSITLAWYSGERTTSGDDLENAIEEFEAGEAQDEVILPTTAPASKPFQLTPPPALPTGDGAPAGDVPAAPPAGDAAPADVAPTGGDAAAPAAEAEGGALTDPTNGD